MRLIDLSGSIGASSLGVAAGAAEDPTGEIGAIGDTLPAAAGAIGVVLSGVGLLAVRHGVVGPPTETAVGARPKLPLVDASGLD